MYFSQMSFKNVPSKYYIRIRTILTPNKPFRYRFRICVYGKARLFIDNKEVIDQWTSQPEKTADTPIFNKLSM